MTERILGIENAPAAIGEMPAMNQTHESPLTRTQNWRGSASGFLVLGVLLAPALAAVWMVPWFVTQDGPAHIYNAQILAWSFDPRSPFQDVYTIQWQPIPNWVGH